MVYKINWHMVDFWEDTRDAENVRVYDVRIRQILFSLFILRSEKADLIANLISVELHVWEGTSAVSIDKALNGFTIHFLITNAILFVCFCYR